MIGSEGTLGFVSQATYNTVVDHPHKASAFIVFKDVREACRAAAVLRRETDVDAVELFDRASLTQCEGHEQIIGLVPTIAGRAENRRRVAHRVPRRDGRRAQRRH
jgi:D-lactate dehydrogenase